MKKWIIGNCMNYIRKNTDYNEIKLKEIEYGLIGIYLTLSKFIIISLLCILLGIFKEMLIFTILFTIIRTTAFGLHATKSWMCLLSSLIIFIIIPYGCIILKIPTFVKTIICSLGIYLMYKNSPADTKKRPIISKKRRKFYNFTSTILTIIFSFLSILIINNFISNCLIFSIILENILISPLIYKIFKLPYNNYINYLEKHPELAN